MDGKWRSGHERESDSEMAVSDRNDHSIFSDLPVLMAGSGELLGKAEIGTVARSIEGHGDPVAGLNRIDFPAAQDLRGGAAHLHLPVHVLACVLHVDEEMDMGIAPINLGNGAR